MDKDFSATDYTAVLADMEAKKGALESAIVGLRAALASGALGIAVGDSLSMKDSVAVTSNVAPSGGPIALPRGAFLGKTSSEAIKLYLSAARRKQTNKEIAQALKEGGMESLRKNFDNLVTNGLFRLKQDGVVLRFDDGWGLAEWYPESFRAKVVEKAATVKRAKGKKKVARKGGAAHAPKAVPPSSPAGPGSQSLIEDCFRAHANTALTPQEIADGLGIRVQTVGLICAKLAHAGKIEKTDNGKFCLVAPERMTRAS